IRRVIIGLLYSFFVVIITLYATRHLKIWFPSPPDPIVKTKTQPNVPPSFSELAEKLLPTVVNISATKLSTANMSEDDSDEDQSNDFNNDKGASPFEKFFKDYLNRKGVSEGNSDTLQALGSGVVIDPNGWIVTNYHVVKDTNQIIVTFENSHILKATLKGFDERTDLALLKVSPKTPLLIAQFGNSDTSKIGDWVLAVGNPYGLSNTVTSGIISSRGRNIDQGPYDDFIQTDAPINRGNSGGPLFNMQGKVVGINTAIFSPSGGSIGIAFAIPSNEAIWVIDQLKRDGKVFRGWLGVRIQEVDESLGEKIHITPFTGALVVDVEADSPAAKAGLQKGDVIIAVDNQSITAQTLPRRIARLQNGSSISLTIIRRNQRQIMVAKIAPLVEKQHISSDQESEEQSKIIVVKGAAIEVSDIDDLLLQKYDLPEGQKGVIVTCVTKKAKGKKSLFHVGDLFLGVNDEELQNVSDLLKFINTENSSQQKNERKISSNTMIRLLVKSDNKLHWVTLKKKDIIVR
ncbi:Do family serine endopeptidase, partial [Commensalibacter sp. Nvir]|uniref:Do family serine endopeptidase n=1 Tax=Commensalibacter sp. Nvir TaxID=3069817 RepID=UPI0030C86F9C